MPLLGTSFLTAFWDDWNFQCPGCPCGNTRKSLAKGYGSSHVCFFSPKKHRTPFWGIQYGCVAMDLPWDGCNELHQPIWTWEILWLVRTTNQLSPGRKLEMTTYPEGKKHDMAMENPKWYFLISSTTRPGERLQKAMENGHRNSGFSHKTWWFSMANC